MHSLYCASSGAPNSNCVQVAGWIDTTTDSHLLQVSLCLMGCTCGCVQHMEAEAKKHMLNVPQVQLHIAGAGRCVPTLPKGWVELGRVAAPWANLGSGSCSEEAVGSGSLQSSLILRVSAANGIYWGLPASSKLSLTVQPVPGHLTKDHVSSPGSISSKSPLTDEPSKPP